MLLGAIFFVLSGALCAGNRSGEGEKKGRSDPSTLAALAQAQAAVTAARRRLNLDKAALASDADTAAACPGKGRSCRRARAKVAADREKITLDQKALDEAWASQLALQHAQFQDVLQKRRDAESDQLKSKKPR